MPDTQAYSVDWTVDIAPEGDVSDDVAELKVIDVEGVKSATVKLDTSKSPHALEELEDISITIEDGNQTVQFDGKTDSIHDDPERPVVTVDARSPDGLLDDATVAGLISEENLFDVINAIIDTSAGKVRSISFDPDPLISAHGTFAGAVDFGTVDIAHVGAFGVNSDVFTQHETAENGMEAELRIDNYENTSNNTYTLDITGNDSDGNTVTASLDLPPADSAQDAFGTDSPKLALSGGNGLWDEVTSISTDIPNFSSGLNPRVLLYGNIFNYVKTEWNFTLDSLTSVRSAISRIVNYISGVDNSNDWEFYVDDSTNELIVQPVSDANPDTHVFREGDNVTKPVATRDLDGVRNFIKVNGAADVNMWVWAYGGDFQWSLDNPFDTGEYPDAGVVFDSSPGGGQNDIDQINLRAERLASNDFTSIFQALEIGKKALREFYRTPVSGTAPIIGIQQVSPGDKAEIYYPSRGIPQKVTDNVYTVEKVEYTVTPNSATTEVEFGTVRPNLADVIRSGGNIIRNDISSNVAQYSTSVSTSKNSVTKKTLQEVVAEVEKFPVVGTLSSQNDDGTWTVDGDDGETYENVQVI